MHVTLIVNFELLSFEWDENSVRLKLDGTELTRLTQDSTVQYWPHFGGFLLVLIQYPAEIASNPYYIGID